MAIPKIGMVERQGSSERQPTYKSPKGQNKPVWLKLIKNSHIKNRNKPQEWYFDTVSICTSLPDGPEICTLELSHDC